MLFSNDFDIGSSKDLDDYAKEGDIKRRTLLIINKSDFLDEDQRCVAHLCRQYPLLCGCHAH